MSLAVVSQDQIVQRPMTALGKNDVEIAVSVDVAEAYAGGGLSFLFQ